MATGKTDHGSELEQSFKAALLAARSTPQSGDAWDHLEALVNQIQQPVAVAELYAELLDGTLAPALRDQLSQRAVEFYDKWFATTRRR